MKKTLIIFLVFICISLCVSAAEARKIKVGLFYNSTAKQSVNIVYDDKTEIITEPAVIASENPIKVEGKQYRGSIIIEKNSEGKLVVINEVDIEDYVASVISKEMSPSFNIEALKAQAVCARTYALSNLGKHRKYGFDLCATEDCQVYGGVDSEHKNTNTATEQTKGKVLKYDGEFAETVYFATSGGYTENAKDVWGNSIPYLQSVEDKYESKSVYASTWTKTITAQKATEILTNKGYNIGNVISIEIVNKTESGSVTRLKVKGDKGEKVFTNESCRTLFGYGMLLSQAYSVSGNGAAPKLFAHSGVVDTSKLTLLSSGGKTSFSGKALNLKGSEELCFQISSSTCEFVFTGRGNGHLVGMSQNGANGMAQAGFTYEQILTHYYKGTNLT